MEAGINVKLSLFSKPKAAVSKLVVLCLLLFFSCNKSDDSQNEAVSFTWTWNGTTYTGNFKESFLQSISLTPMIIGGTGSSLPSTGSGPRISVNSLATGSYVLGDGVTNYITFIAPNGDNLQSTAGTLTITQNANNKLTGSFSANLLNPTGQNSALNGSFTNIKISQ